MTETRAAAGAAGAGAGTWELPPTHGPSAAPWGQCMSGCSSALQQRPGPALKERGPAPTHPMAYRKPDTRPQRFQGSKKSSEPISVNNTTCIEGYIF